MSTIPPSSVEFKLCKGDIFFLPNEAIYRINEKLDDASEQSSVYSEELLPAISANEEYEELYMTEEETAERLLKFGLDINGLPIRDDLLFSCKEAAAYYKPSYEELTLWQKLMGYQPRQIEIPHIALWDYFSKGSCLDISCIAGDQINVIAEEFQVRKFGTLLDDKRKFLRLPLRWSLGRWITNRTFQPNVGLIPSCWLVSKKFYESKPLLFQNPTWYVGIADIATAYDYIYSDRDSYKPGLFVIFSPIWLNINPRDHRPFILLMMCLKGTRILNEMVKVIKEELKHEPNSTIKSSNFIPTKNQIPTEKPLKSSLKLAKSAYSEQNSLASASSSARPKAKGSGVTPTVGFKSSNGAGISSRISHQDNIGSSFRSTVLQKKTDSIEKQVGDVVSEKRQSGEVVEIEEDRFTEHSSLPYYVKSFTIFRTRLGRYLLFGRQYETLYDLVYHLTTHGSPLPHRLNNGPKKMQESVYFASVPSPFSPPHRDNAAMTMNCEQWAARHFEQVTEPSLLSQAFSFVSRSLFDPFKKSHMQFAESLKLNPNEISDAKKYMSGFLKPKKNKASSLPGRNIEATGALTEAKNVIDNIKNNSGAEKDLTKYPPMDESILKTNPAVEIDLAKLDFKESDILGSGAFGAVYRGKMKTANNTTIDVAIKRLKMVALESDLRLPWISEMEEIQIVSHPNVVRFYGFCYDEKKEHAMLTFELMDSGSLADFMKFHEYIISANEHIDFLIQIARGMGHLHSLDPPIVHGDLAARNILMCHHPMDCTCYLLKITDFGLSKTTRHELHFYPDDPDKMPFKWLPPEVLHRRELSTKSDVWSYAITATEIYGVVDPYGMMTNEKVLPSLKEGHRMERPSSMPTYIYDILLRCWRKQPIDRPTFLEVENELTPFYIENETDHIEIVRNRLYVENGEGKDSGNGKGSASVI